MKLTSCAVTDIGRKRERNEDQFLLDDERSLFAVADGMGGHLGGEQASQLAVATLSEVLAAASPPAPAVAESLRFAIRQANRRVFEAAQTDFAGAEIGTTTVAMRIVDGRAAIAHVGDSRAYLLRGGTIQQITDDHSFVWEQVRLGLITPEQARRHPHRNWILRSVGHREEVEVDVQEVQLRAGDRLLLCSDGLSGPVDDAELLALAGAGAPDEAAAMLVDLANERGGEDNITVLLVVVEEVAPCA